VRSAGFADQYPGGAVAASATAGQKHRTLGKGFGRFRVFLAFVDAGDNDSGSGFAFHDELLKFYDLCGNFLMPVVESTIPEPEKYLHLKYNTKTYNATGSRKTSQ
jgi:hypothetical protein